jgi:hypothetical protein
VEKKDLPEGQLRRFAKACMLILMVALAPGICGLSAEVSKENAVQVPFTLEDNSIFVQVEIGDKGPFIMMLDTDTDPSAVDLSFAKSIGLKLRQVRGEVSGGGTERPAVYLTKMEALQVGELPAKDLSALAIDLSGIRGELNKDVKGMLGNNFLEGKIVQIDYPKRVLRFYRVPPPEAIAASSRVVLPFRYDEDAGSMIMEGVAVNGKKILATIDTGSNGTFKLTPAAVESLALTEAAKNGKAQTSQGFRGVAQNTTGKVDVISIGSIDMKSPEVVFFGKGSGRDDRPWGLNIGNAFLKDYVVTLDYRKKMVTLEKP